MITMDDYFKADRHERAFIDSLKPPAAHTHRGKPRSFEMDGYHEATKARREPTHRGVPRTDNTPPWVRMLQAHADQAERNRNA